MYPSKFYTAAKNITLTGMGHISCWQALSTAWMKTLPADLRALIVQVGKEQTIQASKWATELTASSEKAWAKVGTVHRLPAADQAKLAELVAPIGNEILANDPATKEMYLLLKAAVAETRGKPLSTVAEYLK
jgi:TRAP-type C4-dicarboxylate transport system substrate-binding protein